MGILLGFHQSYVGQILSEKTSFSWKFISKVSRVTGKSVAELFTSLENQFPKKDSVEESNKDTVIKLLQAQLKDAREAMPTLPSANNKIQLVIEQGDSKLCINGRKIDVEDLDVLNIFERKVMVEMNVDEIVSK